MVLFDSLEVCLAFDYHGLFDLEQFLPFFLVIQYLCLGLAQRNVHFRVLRIHSLLVVFDLLLLSFLDGESFLQNVDFVVEAVHLLLLVKRQLLCPVQLLHLTLQLVLLLLLLHDF